MASNMSGILPLFKPVGMTSHDCVMKIRKLLNIKRVGHTGTLDPNVTGVLPICIGRATKLSEYMSDYAKTYVAEISIGNATTTEDASGEIVQSKEIESVISEAQIVDALQEMQGKITQVPPMYSAVKVEGKRLYEYAFEGKTIPRPSREVTIHEIKLLTPGEINRSNPTFTIQVNCSKGTYIRTLAVDIGKQLGYPAHMAKLQRIESGPFGLDDSYTFSDIESALENNRFMDILCSVEMAVSHFKKYVIPSSLEDKVMNGAVLPIFENMEKARYRLYNRDGELLAIYIPHPQKQGFIKPEKMIKVKGN